MRRKSTIILLSLLIAVSAMPLPVSGAATIPNLNDKAVYYTPDYRSGDCVLSSGKSMLRRAAIMRGSYKWDSITNTSLRGTATVRGKLFKNTFTYTNDGITYKMVIQRLTGNAAEKTKTIANILTSHPEGVIAWGKGAARTGTHGILVTGYSGGKLYAVDSTHNTHGSNVGIEPWSSTTMKSVAKCTHIWYLGSIVVGTTSPAPAVSTAVNKAALIPSTSSGPVSIRSLRAPSVLRKGGAFSFWGKLKSKKKIKAVKVQVLNSNGGVVSSASAKPKKKKYEIKKLDSRISFGTLETGNYTFIVKAKVKSKWYTVVSQSFKVE